MSKKHKIEHESSKLEPNLFLKRPVDDTLWNLSIFLSKSIESCQARNIENSVIEIEARLGKIHDKVSKKRIMDTTSSESVFNFNSNHSFDPNMSMDQHAIFNQLLNHATRNNPNVKYRHTKITDSFYESLRVSTDQGSGIRSCIQKIKISELHIRSPNCEFDYRISVNLEVEKEVPKDLDSLIVKYTRKKDRLSYNDQLLSIDLTQVGFKESLEKNHELEVEFTKIGALIEQKKLADGNSPNNFCNMVLVLLNTLRMLNRRGRAAPF